MAIRRRIHGDSTKIPWRFDEDPMATRRRSQQGKLDTPLAAAGIYKCLAPQLEAMVNRSSAYSGRQLREDFKKEHAAALQAKVLPYRTAGPDVEAIAAWQAQYPAGPVRVDASDSADC